MENNKLFKSFDYVVRNLFVFEDKVEVRVFFIYKEFYAMNKSLFIKKLKNKDEAYYLDEAKRIINEMIADGSLMKECEKKIKRKKLLPILIPLASAMAIAGITVGCVFGLKSPETVEVIDPEINGLVIEKQTAIIGQDFDTKISINTDLVDNYILPETLAEVKSGDNILEASCYTYEVNNDYLIGTLHIPAEYIKGDISIKLTLDEMPWYLNKKYINSLTKEDINKEGGEVQTLKVNGVDHKVHLIGVDEDYGTIGDESTKIHTTWEFENLLSDENGYSLATQWNDTNDISTNSAHHNYLDSSLRMALVGKKQDKGHILWAQRGETTWSTNPNYKNKSVLDMLPHKLVSVLKTPSKYISIYNETKAEWEEQTVEDKLFLLSPTEAGSSRLGEEPSTTVYSYYENKQTAKLKRSKKQVKNEVYNPIPYPKINYTAESGQAYKDSVINRAGINTNINMTISQMFWFRSPDNTNSNPNCVYVYLTKSIEYAPVYYTACSIAPAFCI